MDDLGTPIANGPSDLSWVRNNVVTMFVDEEVFKHHADWLMVAFKDVVVLRAEYRLDLCAMQYHIAARRFPKTQRGGLVPEYEIEWAEEQVEFKDDLPPGFAAHFKTVRCPVSIRPRTP